MRLNDFEKLQNAEFNFAKLRQILNDHEPISILFTLQPRFASNHAAIALIFLIDDLGFLSVEAEGLVNLDFKLAEFLMRVPSNTLEGVSKLCVTLAEMNKLTLRRLDFILALKDPFEIFKFTYLLGLLGTLGFLNEESTDPIFLSLTDSAFLNDIYQIAILFHTHFQNEFFKEHWEVILLVLAIDSTNSAFFLAILQEFEKQNEMTKNNVDQFFSNLKNFVAEKKPTKEMLVKELASRFLQVFNLYYWCGDAAVSKKVLENKKTVDILFTAGLSATNLVGMGQATQDYYFNSTYFRESIANQGVMFFNLNFLITFFKKYSVNCSEEVGRVLNLSSQNKMILFYIMAIKAEEFGYFNNNSFYSYVDSLLNNQLLTNLESLFIPSLKIEWLTLPFFQTCWKIIADPRFIGIRVPDMLRAIFISLNEMNELTEARLISIFEEFQINSETTAEDFVQTLELKLQDVENFFIDGISEELADKLHDNAGSFYKLCKTGLSFSEFCALESELQDKLLKEENADVILMLHNNNIFKIDGILKLYRCDPNVCDALFCAPEKPEYQKLAKDTLDCHEREGIYESGYLAMTAHQNLPGLFTAPSESAALERQGSAVDEENLAVTVRFGT